jgi:predicted alpha/beta-hydrolase family hydrolase
VTASAPRALGVPIEGQGTVTALQYEASAASGHAAAPVLVLAHGAGSGQRSAFMVRIAGALASRNVTVITFDFPYMQAGRRAPDRQPVLEAAWRAVIQALVAAGHAQAGRVIVGGKSMGGRIASHVLSAEAGEGGHSPLAHGATPEDGADGRIDSLVAGLVLLGYPLHPPGNPARLRVAHLPMLRTPTLVVQGTRDEFGTADEVRRAFAVVPARVEWLVIDGANHSFKVPRGARRSSPEVFDDIADAVAGFVQSSVDGTREDAR